MELLLTRRNFLKFGGLLLGSAMLPACAAPAAAVAAPAAATILGQAARWLAMTAVASGIDWLIARGLDSTFADGTQADERDTVYQHRSGTGAFKTKPVVLSEGQTWLVKFWTPNAGMLTLEPRAAQALSAAVAELSTQVGYGQAAAALLPMSVIEDNGTPPGDPYRTATYQARDGGTVQIAFDARSGTAVETVTAFSYSATYAYAVDPYRPFYLLNSSSTD